MPAIANNTTARKNVSQFISETPFQTELTNRLANQLNDEKSPSKTNEMGRMSIHDACSYGNQVKSLKKVQIILKEIQSQHTQTNNLMLTCLEHKDNDRETPLQIAIRMGHSNVVIELMAAHKKYYNNTSEGIPFNWTRRNEGKPEILQQIYETMPEVIVHLLNSSVQCMEEDHLTNDLNLILDLAIITGNIERQRIIFGRYQEETKWLAFCLKSKKRSILLSHPVVQTFLHEKRLKVVNILWTLITVLMLWLSINTILTLYFFVFLWPYKSDLLNSSLDHPMSNSTNFTKLVQGVSETISCSPESNMPFVILSLAFFFFSAICAVIFLVHCLRIRTEKNVIWHFRSLSFVGNLLYVILVSITYYPVAIQITAEYVNICAWQYISSACTIMLAWLIIIVQLFKLSTFAVYSSLLWEIFLRILKIIGLFAPLLIPFAVSLKILMPGNPEFHFPWVLLKVLVMLVGELNYHETFFKDDNTVKPLTLVPFPNTTKSIYAIFLTVMTVTFFNALLSITFRNIEPLYKSLKTDVLAKQLNEINWVERILFSKPVRSCFSFNTRTPILVTYFQEINFSTEIKLSIKDIKPELQDQIRKIVICSQSEKPKCQCDCHQD